MKNLFTIILLLLIGFTYGQTQIKKSSISTGGGSSTVGNTTVIYAIGEVAVQENTQGAIHISEGFIGPDLQQTSDIKQNPELVGLNIFPNPTANILNVKYNDNSPLKVSIYDLSGKEIIKSVTGKSNLQINVDKLPTGSYLVKVNVKNHSVYYKIIKE